MILRQIRLAKMAGFCYLIGDDSSKTCAVVDPAFETERILAEAGHLRCKIESIINTHGHSDHTAGNKAVMEATGARLLIHAADACRLGSFLHSSICRILGGKGSPPAEVLLQDNDTITIGKLRLTVLHTPGHTPGSICLYTTGNLFTGDTLFVGAVGRTDLSGGSKKQLIESIHKKIYSLPGDTIVWPGHDYGPVPSSTVQREKDTNPFTRS